MKRPSRKSVGLKVTLAAIAVLSAGGFRQVSESRNRLQVHSKLEQGSDKKAGSTRSKDATVHNSRNETWRQVITSHAHVRISQGPPVLNELSSDGSRLTLQNPGANSLSHEFEPETEAKVPRLESEAKTLTFAERRANLYAMNLDLNDPAKREFYLAALRWIDNDEWGDTLERVRILGLPLVISECGGAIYLGGIRWRYS
jgi:hypothetical protein